MFFLKILFFCYWIIKYLDLLYKTFHEKKNCSSNSNLTINRLWRDVIKWFVFNWLQTGSQRSNICKWWNEWIIKFNFYLRVVQMWFFFVLIWKQSNSRPLSWLIIVQHAGRDRPSEYRVSNPHIDVCIKKFKKYIFNSFEHTTSFHKYSSKFSSSSFRKTHPQTSADVKHVLANK